MRRIISLALIFALAFQAPAFAKAKKRKGSSITAKSAVAIDLKSNKILYSRNRHLKLPPASTAKLLTALVVIDRLKMDKKIRVSANAAGVQPTKAYLSAGEYYKTYDLLKALLMMSSNDAGIALAEGVAGSEAKFARLMNKKARKLGAKNSKFKNATGLPAEGQYSTAYDLSLIARRAMKNKTIRAIMRQQNTVIRGSDGKKIYVRNHNEFLKKQKYPIVLGKTGYTRRAQRCFAGVAYYSNKQVAVVVMRSTDRAADIKKILKKSF